MNIRNVQIKTQEPEAYDAGNSGNAVDAVHEIVEIRGSFSLRTCFKAEKFRM